MDKNDIQNYLDKKFPELKFQVNMGRFGPADLKIRLRTNSEFTFISTNCRSETFSNLDKIRFLYKIEDNLYKYIGLFHQALEDIRKERRELR